MYREAYCCSRHDEERKSDDGKRLESDHLDFAGEPEKTRGAKENSENCMPAGRVYIGILEGLYRAKDETGDISTIRAAS